MKLVRRESTLYIRKRVPSRYKPVETRELIWISLNTDSETQAMLKAPSVWQELIEAWEAKLVGATGDAEAAFEAEKNLAAKRGFRYLPAAAVARLPTDEILRRVGRWQNAASRANRIWLKPPRCLVGPSPRA